MAEQQEAQVGEQLQLETNTDERVEERPPLESSTQSRGGISIRQAQASVMWCRACVVKLNRVA